MLAGFDPVGPKGLLRTGVMKIRKARQGDRRAWKILRGRLWPTCTDREHRLEMTAYLNRAGRLAAFVAEREDGRLAGFVEVSLRPDPDPASRRALGYLEGLFVDSRFRHQGVARALVKTAERWARIRGAARMQSDTHRSNRASRDAHRALGYRELEEVVVFQKRI